MAWQMRPQLMGHVLVEQDSHGCSRGLWEWPYARMRRIVSSERLGKLSRVSSTVAPSSSSVRIVSAGMRVPLTTGLPPTFPATLSTRSHSDQSTVIFASTASFILARSPTLRSKKAKDGAPGQRESGAPAWIFRWDWNFQCAPATEVRRLGFSDRKSSAAADEIWSTRSFWGGQTCATRQ